MIRAIIPASEKQSIHPTQPMGGLEIKLSHNPLFGLALMI
ncbi:hypothetical protein XBKB1_2590001 [Xenorhabdus bovienii str. kraussei Becker Underwood]|uniref:Uncharacterized protein n=1 Tax=Xenorhabdus bovienii str. kraussei Becker Underwood TaxID=1398204 RepID=A0A077PTA2_XENBV|nr:hypothetical protein XBKB1_2590001 [Xenorhabdus bovienii str. kraussei Becker Underwood]